MKSRWLHLLITIFIIFSYMQFEYVRYCMEHCRIIGGYTE